MLAGVDQPDTGQLEPGHGLKIGYYAQEHENLDVSRSVLDNMMSAAPDITAVEALNPERVLILPDGVEDLWGRDYAELVELA